VFILMERLYDGETRSTEPAFAKPLRALAPGAALRIGIILAVVVDLGGSSRHRLAFTDDVVPSAVAIGRRSNKRR